MNYLEEKADILEKIVQCYTEIDELMKLKTGGPINQLLYDNYRKRIRSLKYRLSVLELKQQQSGGSKDGKQLI